MDLSLGMENSIHKNKYYYIILVIGVLFVAFNLRPAITSVGPLIGMIRDDIGFSNWSVALLTSLPLIAFALMSPIAPKLANKLTNELTLMLGLFVLFVGVCFRSLSIIFFIFLGTLFVGLGIAICNVLLPGVIKEKFPTKVAVMTSLYTTSMSIFATAASGLSVPLAENLELGWQKSLLLWAMPAFVGAIIWLYIFKKSATKEKASSLQFYESNQYDIWKDTLAWKVAIFMGLQSLIYYVTISWLPEMLIDFGMKKTTAGFFLSYFQFIGIPTSFIIPMIAVKLHSQRILVLIVNICFIFGVSLLILQPTIFITTIAITFIGFSSSANFALSLTFLSIRAKNARDAAELSGMAQSIGYTLAAVGPIFIGFVYDLTYDWFTSLMILIVITFIIVYVGLSAGQNKYVLERKGM